MDAEIKIDKHLILNILVEKLIPEICQGLSWLFLVLTVVVIATYLG